MDIVGRKKEMLELQRHYDSGRPELVIVYGCRRVGKTIDRHSKYSDWNAKKTLHVLC